MANSKRAATYHGSGFKLKAGDIRVGQTIDYSGEDWQVAARAPEPGTFHLHRWVGDEYQTAKAHVRDLRSKSTVIR